MLITYCNVGTIPDGCWPTVKGVAVSPGVCSTKECPGVGAAEPGAVSEVPFGADDEDDAVATLDSRPSLGLSRLNFACENEASNDAIFVACRGFDVGL